MKRNILFAVLAFPLLLQVGCSSHMQDDLQISKDTYPKNSEVSTFTGSLYQDSLALVALYKATDGDKWVRRMRWLSQNAVSVDKWYGVKVAEKNGVKRVVELNLPVNNLCGKLPPEMKNLTALRKLNLSYNKGLKGNLIDELFQMRELEVLNLRFCSFTGAIPPSIGNLTKLDSLDLWTFIPNVYTGEIYPHRLSGSLPSEIGKLTNARFIRLGRHDFSGSIPASITNLKSLVYLDLSQCKFTGVIPVGFEKMEKLEELYLFENKLSGNIPEDICGANSLEYLRLDNNLLEGNIPENIGKMKKIRQLYLFKNKLTGPIPTSLSQASTLTLLSLNDNQLSGEIPAWLGNSNPNLIDADLKNNNFTGKMPVLKGRYIPGAGTTYPVFHVAGNKLSGELPECYTKFIPYNEGEMGLPRYIPQQTGYGFTNLPLQLP